MLVPQASCGSLAGGPGRDTGQSRPLFMSLQVTEFLLSQRKGSEVMSCQQLASRSFKNLAILEAMPKSLALAE